MPQEYREWLSEDKREFFSHFTKKDWKNEFTRRTLIAKLHQYRQRETAPQFIIPAIMLG